ncbi:hypothetical protein DVH24_034237 [Malus domestica]|uniref:Uncharacterized protein n=1 Tax=Malus domestica TaxID=3750 RepID=A0A498KQI5_MALDO|nr:hypothetical protein DVH24_034237 [Malus domestica]
MLGLFLGEGVAALGGLALGANVYSPTFLATLVDGYFGSPHGQSFDLIGSDDPKPELEGFVVAKDDDPTSIAGEGNSFD